VKARAAALGIPVYPWKRCYSMNDILDLLAIAKSWNAPAVGLNLEKELDHDVYTPAQVVHAVNQSGFKGEVVIITEAWLYESVHWDVFSNAGYSVVLELFPRDSNAANDPMGCVAHAHAKGVKNVFMCWDGRDEVHWPRPNESVYTFDDAAGRWWPRG
jgi:hypothetical protein